MKITIQDARTSVTLQQRDFRVTISGARGPAGPAGPSEWGGIDGDIEDQTDLYNALQAKVPYTGATQDVNLGEYGAQLGNLEFDNTPTNIPTTAGSVYWNDTDGTLNLVLKGGQTISRIGETQHIRALNNTGAQIARGKVVYVVGAQGQRLTIGLADADTEILSKDTIGFTAEVIADGAEGFVIVQGVINNVSTTGMTDGATVYLSQTAGGYTTTAPTDPAHLVVLGFIVNGGSGGAGSIYVKVDNGYELEELHGVADAAKVTPVGADALLLRDSEDNNLWKRLTWTNALAGVKSHMDTFKSVAGGYASLDGSGKVPASELPSYVDDVVEVANYAALPGIGETGKIYVTLDTNKCYRWTGSVYVEVSAGGGVDTLTTTGTSGAATLVGSTLNIPQYQGVLTNPVTGTGTAGQVAYFSGTSAVTGSSLLFWDSANGRLGIGTNAPLNTYTQSQLHGVFARYEVRNSNANQNMASWDVYTNTLVSPDFFGRTAFKFEGGINNASRQYQIYVSDSSTPKIAINGSGNVMINSIVDAGQRLQVYGSTLLRGSGTTSATTALLVQNSTPTELFKVADDGLITIQSSGYINTLTSAAVNQRNFEVSTTISPTSNTKIGFQSFVNFSPTSGTASLTYYNVGGTINQTGGSNGITRGLYVNPTLTAAADWRSIEWSNNTGWGLYGAGSANNYLGGGLGIGSTVVTGYSLHLGKSMTGGVNTFGVMNDGQIQSDSTSSARYFMTLASTQAATFTVGTLFHFLASQGTFGLNSTVLEQFGFHAASQLTGATNNYGFYGNIASGTGRWNLYMNGTAANYLAGNTSIGTTTSSGRLTVRGSGTTNSTNGLLVEDNGGTDTFTIRDDGGYAFKGGTVGVAQTGYTTFTNLTTDRTCDANATTVEELADILGTLIEDLKTKGIISA